jgi:hypothetical protein
VGIYFFFNYGIPTFGDRTFGDVTNGDEDIVLGDLPKRISSQ